MPPFELQPLARDRGRAAAAVEGRVRAVSGEAKKYTAKEILQSYAGRRYEESRGRDYCGSCSLEVHVSQMADPDSWVYGDTADKWLADQKSREAKAEADKRARDGRPAQKAWANLYRPQDVM